MKLPDGEHLIEGKIYVVVDGEIIEIKDAPVVEEEAMTEEIALEETVVEEEVVTETPATEEMAIDPAADAEAILAIVQPVIDEQINAIIANAPLGQNYIDITATSAQVTDYLSIGNVVLPEDLGNRYEITSVTNLGGTDRRVFITPNLTGAVNSGSLLKAKVPINSGLLTIPSGSKKIVFDGSDLISGLDFVYPYVGHYDNPYQPTNDINFGQLREELYLTSYTTANNLVNTYWLQFLEETTGSAIISSNGSNFNRNFFSYYNTISLQSISGGYGIDSDWAPNSDNTYNLGQATSAGYGANRRWQRLYSNNTTISTSDVRLKTDVSDSPLGLGDVRLLAGDVVLVQRQPVHQGRVRLSDFEQHVCHVLDADVLVAAHVDGLAWGEVRCGISEGRDEVAGVHKDPVVVLEHRDRLTRQQPVGEQADD